MNFLRTFKIKVCLSPKTQNYLKTHLDIKDLRKYLSDTIDIQKLASLTKILKNMNVSRFETMRGNGLVATQLELCGFS